jgi:molecular chaperone HscB
MARAVHPDVYQNKSEAERDVSATVSAGINNAYRTLRDPLARAQYLLRLNGLDAIGEQAGKTPVDAALLMEVMEVNEELVAPNITAARTRQLLASAKSSAQAQLRQISDAFAAGELQAASKCVVALQYYTTLVAAIEKRLAELDPHAPPAR